MPLAWAASAIGLRGKQLAGRRKRGDARGYVDGRSEQIARPAHDRPMVQPRPGQRQARLFAACLQQRSKRLDRAFRLGKRQHRLVADPLDRRLIAAQRLAHHAFENLENGERGRVSIDVRDGAEPRKIDECNGGAGGGLADVAVHGELFSRYRVVAPTANATAGADAYCMNQPWLTTSDWPVSALVFAAAK